MRTKRIYLDHAASTPVDPRVFKAMRPYLTAEFGNPGSLHSFGQAALGAVDRSRETIANALGADFREIIFTGSATEANNLILRGTVEAAQKILPQASPFAKAKKGTRQGGRQDEAPERKQERRRIIVSAVEHESVLETARDLEKNGVEVVYLPVDKNGIVKLEALKHALTPTTVLVSIMYVNNETGAVQPIAKVSEIIRDFRASMTANLSSMTYPLFHTDAAQALQFLPCLPRELGIDAMTISAHKIYGPKGAGALYVSGGERNAKNPRRLPLQSILTGGGQEYGLRSGTENVPAIAGFGKAVALAASERDARKEHIVLMRDRFLNGLKKIFPKVQVNGGAHAVPHILNLWLPGHAAPDLLMRLDLAGVAVSSGSACRSRSFMTSYVLEAMGLPAKRARESIRVSFGAVTEKEEIDAALRVMQHLV